MNAMDYMPIRIMFWFGVGGGVVVFVYTVVLWLLLRGDRIEEEVGTTATAPLLPTIPEEPEA
jgi:uncharacterized membrane protein